MIFFYLMVFGMSLTEQSFYGLSIAGLTIAKLLGILAALYCIFQAMMSVQHPRPSWKLLAALLTSFFFIVFCSYASIDHGVSRWYQGILFVYLAMFALYFTVLLSVDTEKRLRWTLWSAVGGVALGGLYCLREYQKGSAIYGAGYRPGYVTGDPNYYTLSAVVVIPLCLMMLARRKGPWLERGYLVGCLIITLAAVVVAASRGGFLGLIASVGYLAMRSRQRWRIAITLVVLLLPPMLLAPRSPLARLLHPSGGDNGAKEARLITWNAGIRMIKTHPFFGIGVGTFESKVLSYEIGDKDLNLAHNTYIEIAAELGVPALLLYVTCFVVAFRLAGKARQLSRAAGGLVYQTSLGLQASIIGGVVGLFFLSAQFEKLPWMAIAMAPALTGLARLQENANPPAAATVLSRETDAERDVWSQAL